VLVIKVKLVKVFSIGDFKIGRDSHNTSNDAVVLTKSSPVI
jgi:hypothetical protein